MPSFLRMGSWIGGDRDGNPFVTADVTRQTLTMQSERAMRFYLEELHQLGGELSLDGRIVRRLDGLRALWPSVRPTTPSSARTSPIGAPSSASYARLAATAWALDKLEAPHPPVGPAPAYDSVNDFKADLDTIFASLSENGSAALARGRLRALRRAVDVFGFHLASLDLQAELRRPRARHGGARRSRGPRRLSRARRGRPGRAADRRARQHAPALLGRISATARRRRTSSPC